MTNNQLTDEELQTLIVELQQTAYRLNGTNSAYLMSDAIKPLRELQERRKAERDSEPVAWIVGRDEIEEFNRGREIMVMRDGDDEQLEKIPLYRHAQQPVKNNESIPQNLDKALGVVGVALPESKEDFNFQIERWIQRLIDRVIRYADEFQALPSQVVPEGLRLALSNAGIAAPESDEMLAATHDKYVQALVSWVRDRKPFQPAPLAPEILPCAVELKPGLILEKGCKTTTLLTALRSRANHDTEIDAMTPEERAEHDASIETFKAMLAAVPPAFNRKIFNMNHLMIDLETMGKNTKAPIVSIGAVFFNPQNGEVGKEFYTAVNLESAMEQGAVPDGDTILWWLKQSPEARSAICVDNAMPLSVALSELTHFINRHSDNPKYLKVWGNGATFDNIILRGAYERSSLPCPWEYFNDHDVRTIVTLGRTIGFDPKKAMPFEGDAHNALADAKHQAKYVSAIWQKLTPTTHNGAD